MAQVNFLSDINLSNNQLLNLKLQNLATPPATTGWTGINLGWTYWNTTDLKAYSWNGASWTSLSYTAPNHTGDVTSIGDGATTISANAVTNSKLSQMAAHTFKGNNSGALANAVDLTATQLTAELDGFTSALKGLAPASGGGTVNYLRADGSWAAPGDMVLNAIQTVSGAKTFLDGKLVLRNVANTFDGVFTNINTANRTYTLPNNSGTVALLTDTVASATNLAGGLGGQVHYQSAAGVTTMLANGTAGQILSSQGTTLAPQWINAPVGDMVLGGVQTVTGAKTFLDTKFALRNVANTFNGSFVNTNTADRIYTLPDASGTVALLTNTFNIGTTAIALNRAAASLALTGITSIDGSAASLTASRNIYGGAFNGTADVTGIIASAYGGTGNGFTKFTGPTTAEKTFILPNASDTLVALGTVGTFTAAQTFNDTKFFLRNVANTFSASFVNAITANRVYTLPDLAGTIALTSQIVATNLGYAAAPTNGTVTNSNGTSATLALADATNAGLLAPADFIKLASGVVLKTQYASTSSVLVADTASAPTALVLGTNTVLGRVAGNIQAIAIDSDLSTVSAADDTVPSAKAVRAAIDLAVTSGMVNKGAYNAATNTPDLDTATSIAVKNGWMYTVSVAGTFFTQPVQVGDVVICNVDKAATLTVEADWTALNKNIPDIVASSEIAPGIIEIATQAEVTTATDDIRAITPLKLRSELDGANRVYVAPSFGNGTLTSFAFTHGLAGGSLYPTVVITDTVSKEVVYTQVAVTSSTVVTVSFNVAPTANQYTVVIKK
jgi:hypothetical protein